MSDEQQARDDNLNRATGAPDPESADLGPAPRDARLTQGLVILAAVIAMAFCWFSGRWLHVPVDEGFSVSLLQQPGGMRVLAIVLALLLFIVCTVLGQIIAGRRWMYAGLFAAALGFAALSARGGPSRFVYFRAASNASVPSIFLTLFFEQALLFTVVAFAWYWLTRAADAVLARQSEAKPDAISAGAAAERALRGAATSGPSQWSIDKTQALAAQAVIMALGILLFVHTDSKKTVVLGVFFAALAATALTEYWFQDEKLGAYYWAGPLVVGLAGYLINYITVGGGTVVTGQLSGMFAALARPLPLDYAGVGVAGALLGYWVSAHHEPDEVPYVPLNLTDVLATTVFGSRYLSTRRRVIKRNLQLNREKAAIPPQDNGQPQ